MPLKIASKENKYLELNLRIDILTTVYSLFQIMSVSVSIYLGPL